MGTYFYSGPVRKVAGDDKGKLDTTRPRPGMVRVEFDGYGPRNIFPFESGQPRLVLADSGHDERVDPDRIALGTRVLSPIEGQTCKARSLGCGVYIIHVLGTGAACNAGRYEHGNRR